MATNVTGTNRSMRDALGFGLWLLTVLSLPVLSATYCWLSFGPRTLWALPVPVFLFILLAIFRGIR
jgi:hypothetical protein